VYKSEDMLANTLAVHHEKFKSDRTRKLIKYMLSAFERSSRISSVPWMACSIPLRPLLASSSACCLNDSVNEPLLLAIPSMNSRGSSMMAA
jgi:hypothetical protein